MIDYFKCPDMVYGGDSAEFELGIENCGVAPIYKKIPLKVRLLGKENSYEFETDIDIRAWLPGKSVEKFLLDIPENIALGEYDVEIGIYNELVPVVYLCTDAVRNNSFYKVGKITVG